MANRTFQPFTMEITKQLDLAEADDAAVARFRENPFGNEDEILKTMLGPHSGPAEFRILWAKFREWRQVIGFIEGAPAPAAAATPSITHEYTRKYHVEAG